MNSIRIKLTLALLLMSFAAIAVVGLTSRTLTLQRFDDLVVERASIGFQAEVIAYYQAYGSWEAAREAETFFEFVIRTRPEGFTEAPAAPAGNTPLPEGAPPQPRSGFVFGGEPPPFAVTDQDGIVLFPMAGFRTGDQVGAELFETASPLILNGETIGWSVPLQRPALTEMEVRYLNTIEDSWLLSLGLAAILAIPFGLLLGGRLTQPIQELTTAIQAMGRGDLNQQVPVRSKDELGDLSSRFNQMSADLARAHTALEASREQISKQAVILKELSRQDDLTGLMNRRAFYDEGGKLFARARRYEHPLSVAMADIDHFKEINDRYTHAMGDQVLRCLADLLRRHLRETDLVARYGGEEFAIAFPETPLDEAMALAERLRAEVEAFDWSELQPGLKMTLSIGVSERSGWDSLEATLQAADTRLYAAKQAGRNRIRD